MLAEAPKHGVILLDLAAKPSLCESGILEASVLPRLAGSLCSARRDDLLLSIEASHPAQLGFSQPLPLLMLDCNQMGLPNSRKHAISVERACGAV